MIRCHFCREALDDTAVSCRYCGTWQRTGPLSSRRMLLWIFLTGLGLGVLFLVIWFATHTQARL